MKSKLLSAVTVKRARWLRDLCRECPEGNALVATISKNDCEALAEALDFAVRMSARPSREAMSKDRCPDSIREIISKEMDLRAENRIRDIIVAICLTCKIPDVTVPVRVGDLQALLRLLDRARLDTKVRKL